MSKLTHEQFVEKSNQIHQNKYDYSNTIYINSSTKIIVICSIHGEFQVTPNNHLSKKIGCQKCSNSKVSEENRKYNQKEFIERAILIHGNKYDYSSVRYIDTKQKIDIICPHHGIFNISAGRHIYNKAGCQICSQVIKSASITDTLELFIKKAIEIHGNKYIYSLVQYTKSNQKIILSCKQHGEFKLTPNSHLCGSGCPKCKSSKGETKIRQWLDKNNIKFIEQKTFKGCGVQNNLKFDFYLTELNICIEYDGIQHFKPWSFTSDRTEKTKNSNFQLSQMRDQIKTQYCENNKIKLIRIPYTLYKKIDIILDQNLHIPL